MTGGNSIWYYIRSYKFNSIFARYFCLILCIVLIPLIGTSAVIFNYNNTVVKQEISGAHEKSLHTAKEMLDIIVDEIDRVAMRILYDSSVDQFMTQNISKDYQGYEQVMIVANAVNAISMLESEYIQSVELYSDISNLVLSSENGFAPVPAESQEWVLQYKQNRGAQNKWVTARSGENAWQRFISFFYTNPLLSQEKRGVAVLNVSAASLQKRINEGDWNNGEEFLIVDENETVLFSSGQLFAPGSQLGRFFPEEKSVRKGNAFVKMGSTGEQVLVSEVSSQHNGWRYVSIIPMAEYAKKTDALRNWLIAAILIVLLVTAFLAFGLAVRIYMPIRDIVSTVENPEQVRDKLLDSGNEYSYIVSKYLKVLDKKTLAEEELQRRIAMLRQAQMTALQAQIHPHFLYNTLQAISWMAIGLTKDENDVSRAIKCLSDLLHATLETDSYLVSVGDEIRYAEKYIEIQKLRYRNKFDVVWDVEPALCDYAVAKLTLQPLLENSLGHSIKYLKRKGKIWVCAHSRGDWIELQVRDDGVGMSQETARQLNADFSSEYIAGGRHIGLRNVNQRLRLIFGVQCRLEVEPLEQGVNVKTMIPKIKKSEHDS